MRNHFLFPMTVFPALLAMLGIAYSLASRDTESQSRAERVVPTNVEGWHSTRRGAGTATPSAMPAASGELDPALQSLDGVTGHG